MMDGTSIEQLRIDSEVCLPGTARKIMAGKDYCQMVHEHKLVEDTIYAKVWEASDDWSLPKRLTTSTTSQTLVQP
jgi:hypothetical protein